RPPNRSAGCIPQGAFIRAFGLIENERRVARCHPASRPETAEVREFRPRRWVTAFPTRPSDRPSGDESQGMPKARATVDWTIPTISHERGPGGRCFLSLEGIGGRIRSFRLHV